MRAFFQAVGLVPLLLSLVATTMLMAVTAEISDACLQKCGNVTIPYPFGTTDECRLSGEPTFSITCNTSFSPPKPFIGTSNLEVTNISFDGEIYISGLVASDCYKNTGSNTESIITTLKTGNFTISPTKNRFMAIGCDTQATFRSWLNEPDWFQTGCSTYCLSDAEVEDSCSGICCCLTPIPKRLSFAEVELSSYENHVNVSDFNNCSYAFLAHIDFKFKKEYLHQFREESVSVVLDWTIGNQTCEAAVNRTTFLCKANTTCFDRSEEGVPGYLCKCKDGYEGNPYLQHPDHGCKDIDECSNGDLNNCTNGSKCINIPGSHKCACPNGYQGDGVRGGAGCKRNPAKVVQISLGIGICSVVLLLTFSWIYLTLKKRKLIKLKETFFKQNGGLMLQQRLVRQDSSTKSETAKIFTEEELNKATNNYAESQIVGKGGYGTVYRGVLADGTVVAIKKSKVVDKTQTEQFINEVVVLSQINHRNVVKLLGCCLEKEVPLLVYEFVTNGTLFDHLHKNRGPCIPWSTRLRIATETAGVLSYLHSAASTPVIHRDIKTTNILLDDSYTAKVSDFGASRLVPMDHMELSTMVQGTLGYLDPEYLHTSQLTEKSDVYSFGVVLIELLTGMKALAFDRPEEERSLAMHFKLCLREDRLFHIVQPQMVDEVNKEQIKGVAMVAKSCLKLKGEDRPMMKEVAMELEGLLSPMKHPWGYGGSEPNADQEALLTNLDSLEHYRYGGDSYFSDLSGFENSRRSIMSPLGNGR